MVKIKNTSRAVFHLNMDFIKEGQSVDLRINQVFDLKDEEYELLRSLYPNTFASGFLTVENESNVNSMSDEEIEKLVEQKPAKFTAAINKITSTRLLGDIMVKVNEEAKGEKYTKPIEARLKVISEDLAM